METNQAKQPSDFGQFLISYRKEHNLSQKQLARKCNLSEVDICKYESGETRFPNKKNLEKMSKFFDTDLSIYKTRSKKLSYSNLKNESTDSNNEIIINAEPIIYLEDDNLKNPITYNTDYSLTPKEAIELLEGLTVLWEINTFSIMIKMISKTQYTIQEIDNQLTLTESYIVIKSKDNKVDPSILNILGPPIVTCFPKESTELYRYQTLWFNSHIPEQIQAKIIKEVFNELDCLHYHNNRLSWLVMKTMTKDF